MPNFKAPYLTVEIIHREVVNGRRRPLLCSCIDNDNKSDDYFVKLHDNMGAGSVKELVSALVGRAIGLPIPQPAIVEIDPVLLDLAGIQHTNESRFHIGSLAVMGDHTAFPGDYKIPAVLLPTAFNIFAWDMLIDNADRQSDNPNLLFDGTTFTVFDHEGALGKALFIGAKPPAWNFHRRQIAYGHTFYKNLRPLVANNSFDSFFETLSTLDNYFFDNIKANIPTEWNHQALLTNICEHFCVVRDDNVTLRQELLKSLS